MSSLKVKAEKRDLGIKNSFRKSKKDNYIPCVLYNKKKNQPVKIQRDIFEKTYQSAKSNTVFEIELGKEIQRAFIKAIDISLEKKMDIVHIDFYVIEPKKKIKIKVPFVTTGVPEGVKMGGHVESYQKSILVECDGDKIPEKVSYDISSLELGRRLYLKDIKKDQSFKLLGADDNCLLAVLMSRKSVSTQALEGEDVVEDEQETASQETATSENKG